MPVHDWTRVIAGTFHHFHHEWITCISRALNSGLLPSEYYAMAEQITGGLGPDVVALGNIDRSATDDDDASDGFEHKAKVVWRLLCRERDSQPKPKSRSMRRNEGTARITFPDVIKAVVEQSTQWQETDFAPLPCAHPNGHTLSYAYRSGSRVTPLARFVDLEKHLDLLSGRITFNRERARELIGQYLSRQACGGGGGDCGCGEVSQGISLSPRNGQAGSASSLEVLSPTSSGLPSDLSSEVMSDAVQFFTRALTESLNPRDMFRITTTSFMDAYKFDVRQLMKECVHFVLPSGHLVPFSAYNVLYRNGHVQLPPLIQKSGARQRAVSEM